MKKNGNKGISLLEMILLGFVLILVLSYFKINIKEVVQSPTGQSNINYVRGVGENAWNNHLKEPGTYLWQNIFIDIFWKSFINNMERIRDGKPTDLEKYAPIIKFEN